MLWRMAKFYFMGVLFRFSQRPNLKKHLLESHAGGGQALVGQTYPCPTCSILFRTREDLAQHILKQVGQLKQSCHVYLRVGSKQKTFVEQEVCWVKNYDEYINQ